MTDREAMQQALDALGFIYSPLHVREINKVGAAMNALRERLAQPEQEPVAHTTGHCENHKQKGGCQLHNLQCGWPDCDRKPITTSLQSRSEQAQWDAIPDAFNEWWDADYDDTGNPYRKDSPAYWAWSGWKAASKQPEQEPVAWRDHVEQRLLTWRQSFVNRSGDQLALDDFMDKQSLDDLVDFVCDEYTSPPQRKPLKLREIEKCIYDANNDPIVACRNVEAAHGIKENT